MRLTCCLYLAIIVFISGGCNQNNSKLTIPTVDVLVIGGGASGTTAGIQSARLGAKTLIVEEFEWLGGMLTSSGVSAIDGDYNLHSGLWEEFRQNLYQHYGGAEAVKTGWVSNVLFEPSVADSILKAMVSDEKNLSVEYDSYITGIRKEGDGWLVTFFKKNGFSFDVRTKLVVDATELGDVAKMAGIPYLIGMDSKASTGESIALDKPRNIVQDLTYVAILKDYGEGVDKTIAKPSGYNREAFLKTCSGKCEQSDRPLHSSERMMEYGKLPNGKYMINWPVYGNDYYLNVIEMSREEREKALKAAKLHTLRYIYYLQTGLGYKNLGLADDEFPTDDLLPFMPYHRESRRIKGEVLFTLNYIDKPYDQPEKLYRTGIAVGDYPVDHHHSAYSLEHKFPDLHFYPVPSYALPLGTLIPKKVDNFIVAEKSISVSNIVNGTTRLQPVCLLIGQAAGALAATSVKEGKTPREVSVRDIQSTLLKASGYILPYVDVKPSDSYFLATQKIGATGILRLVGKNRGWANETFFYPDSLVQTDEVINGIRDFSPSVRFESKNKYLLFYEAINLVFALSEAENLGIGKLVIQQRALAILEQHQINVVDVSKPLNRAAFALILNDVIDPFNLKGVTLKGGFIK